jgi:hypothetical protein
LQYRLYLWLKLSFSKFNKNNLNILNGHPFFCKIHSYKEERPPKVIFQLNVVHNWASNLSQISMDEKSSPFVTHSTPFVTHSTPLSLPTKWLWRHLGVNLRAIDASSMYLLDDLLFSLLGTQFMRLYKGSTRTMHI